MFWTFYVCEIDTCCQFHKHFAPITYGPINIRCSAYYMYAPIQCFQNVQDHSATVKGMYVKVLIKLNTSCPLRKHFMYVTYGPSK
jgi:hypothetical protein